MSVSAIKKTKLLKKLSRNMVLNKSRSDDIDAVTKLDLWCQGICDISLVEEMPNLEVVSLTSNKIQSLKSLRHCRNIREIYLRKNNIEKLEEVAYLKELSKLEKLWLSDNPCTECDNYRPTVIRTLPTLKYLDNIAITDDDKIEAEKVGVLLELLPEMEADPISRENTKIDCTDTPSIEVASCVDSNSPAEKEYQLPNATEPVGSVNGSEKLVKQQIVPKPQPTISHEPPAASASSVPSGDYSDIDVSLEKANRLRAELGLKPLSSSSHDSSVHSKQFQIQPSNNHEKDVRQAAFYLVKVLDKESLLFIGEAIATRLRNEFNDRTFGGGNSGSQN